ncbi:MAG: DNA methyltransferase [Thermoplasmata archaeon]
MLQPPAFTLEPFTTWSFPDRGEWATHRGNYRGNWAPQIPRNLILRYTKPGEMVLDQMCGSGTTLVEARLTGRNAIGVDIREEAIMLTRDRLNFTLPRTLDDSLPRTKQRTFVGDARNLDKIDDCSIDLIATHPPYANIIPYSKAVPGDLSMVHSIDEFVGHMRLVARECFRVLKPDGYCGILIGDTRRHRHYVPIAYRTLGAFLSEGFILREDIIKHQWQCKSTPYWVKKSLQWNFLMIMHEHLFVFRKPAEGEDTKKLRESMAWQGGG